MPSRKQTSFPTTPPSFTPEQAIPLIQRQLEKLEQIRQLDHADPKIKGWVSTTVTILHDTFGKPNGDSDQRTHDFEHAYSGHWYIGMSEADRRENQTRGRPLLKNLKAMLVDQVLPSFYLLQMILVELKALQQLI